MDSHDLDHDAQESLQIEPCSISCQYIDPVRPLLRDIPSLAFYCVEQEIAQLYKLKSNTTQVMSLISGAEAGGGTELSGPNDPLRLTAWHSVDASSATIVLRFEAVNQLAVRLENVTLR